MDPEVRPVRVAIVNDYPVVVAGVAAMLAGFPDRVEVVELTAGLPVASPVDVILYDTFGTSRRLPPDVRAGAAHVVVFSWSVHEGAVRGALAQGAAGFLSKGLEAEQVVSSLERILLGETLTLLATPLPEFDPLTDWPGRQQGLTAREAEVVALITQGLTNAQISRDLFLSINSIKTYIRTAYRKMGVESRSQAVLWGVHHGFEPVRMRVTDPA